MIDLHTHTFYSDGAFSPQKVVEMAKKNGVNVLSITDHDAWEATPKAKIACQKVGIEYLEGIEFSADSENQELHIIGYALDYKKPIIQDYISGKRRFNLNRIKKVVERFQKIGFKIDFEQVAKLCPSNLKRVHVVKSLLLNYHNISLLRKYIKQEKLSVDVVWKYFLLPGQLAYAPSQETAPEKIISLIHQAGGIACLAHPGLVFWNNFSKDLLKLVESGIDAIECFYPEHSEQQTQKFIKICEKYNLLVTGGTDFHGGNVHPNVDIGVGKGNMNVPYKYFKKIKEKSQKIQG